VLLYSVLLLLLEFSFWVLEFELRLLAKVFLMKMLWVGAASLVYMELGLL
jgi:hypothetical protein